MPFEHKDGFPFFFNNVIDGRIIEGGGGYTETVA